MHYASWKPNERLLENFYCEIDFVNSTLDSILIEPLAAMYSQKDAVARYRSAVVQMPAEK